MTGRLPLTFGVEVEFLFGILNGQINHDPRYRQLVPRNYVLQANDRVSTYRTFDPEDPETRSLLQAATILRQGGLDVGAVIDDHYVPHPRTSEVLSEWTNGRVRSIADWSFTGLELISPILKAPKLRRSLSGSRSLREVKGYLDLMKSVPSPHTPYLFSALPVNASVHVHFGLKPDQSGPVDMPVKMLKHLAWLVLAFEDVIALLHHPERHGYRGSKIWDHGQSNRNSNGITATHHPCRMFSPLDAFIEIFSYQQLNEVDGRMAVLDTMCKKWSEHEGFACKTRSVFVNYLNVVPASKGDKSTVEFRQHHGTLEAEDVAEWVYFLTALMRTAERKSNEEPEARPLPQATIDQVVAQLSHRDEQEQTFDEISKYADLFAYNKRTLKELFDLLRLPIARRRYWYARAVRFQGPEFDDFRGQSCCELPCSNPPFRDAVGWAKGELDNVPWDSEDEEDEEQVEQVEQVVQQDPEQDEAYDDEQDAEWEYDA